MYFSLQMQSYLARFKKYISTTYPFRYLFLICKIVQSEFYAISEGVLFVFHRMPASLPKKCYILGSGPSLNSYINHDFSDGYVIALTTSCFFPCDKDIVFYEQCDKRLNPNFSSQLEKSLDVNASALKAKHFYITNYKYRFPKLNIPKKLAPKHVREFPWFSLSEMVLDKDYDYFYKSSIFSNFIFRVRGSFSRALFLAAKSDFDEIVLIGFDGTSREYFWQDTEIFGSQFHDLAMAYKTDIGSKIHHAHRTTMKEFGELTIDDFIAYLKKKNPSVAITRPIV